MADSVDLDGLQTWYDEHGDGDPLVLLHPGGAGVDARTWRPNLPGPAEHFRVFTPERRAHGDTPAEHYDLVVAKPQEMHAEEPRLTTGELCNIDLKTLVMVADDDEVTLEHAITMYRSIPNSALAVVPGTSQGLLVEKPALCNLLLLDFLTNDPVATMAPIRRAESDRPSF